MTTATRHDTGKPELHHFTPGVFNLSVAKLPPEVFALNHAMNLWFYQRNPSYLRSIRLVEPSVATVLSWGATKYDAYNYTKGMAYSRVLNSFRRHILAIANGEDLDPESTLPHLSHAKCNILFALTYHLEDYDYTAFDDRPKLPPTLLGDHP